MKRIIILIAAVLCANLSIAQKQKSSNVPAAVKTAFNKEYAAATAVKWEKENGSYEASFTNAGNKMSALYSPSGVKEETEVSIPVAQLPDEARKYAATKGKVKGAAEITKSDGTINYEAEVNGKALIFDRSGKFIKETKD